jgi:hypothetical protein
MRRTKIVTALSMTSAVVVLALSGCGTAGHSPPVTTPPAASVSQDPYARQSADAVADTDASKDVRITSVKFVNDPYSGRELDTKYTVTNPTGDKVSYSITFEYLDKSGVRIGYDSGDVESLTGHQAARESLTFWGQGADVGGAVSVRVVGAVRIPIV